jgi:hypothetical protein
MAHVPQKGSLTRNEKVAGLHDGVLVNVGWGGDKNASLIVRLRFPKAADVDRLRAALVDDVTLDTLPGKTGARRKLAVGPLKPLEIRWKHPEYLVDDESFTWCRRPGFRGVSAKDVPGWVGTLVQAVRRVTPGFAERCEQCGTSPVRSFVTVDDAPMILCNTCQQRILAEGEMAERAYDMTEARHLNGLCAAMFAALVGAILWAAVAVFTDRILVAGAMGIGLLVALAYKWGAQKLDNVGRVIGFVMTLGSVVLGQVIYYAWIVSEMRPELGFRFDVGWEVYKNAWAHEAKTEVFAVFFGLIGAWVASAALIRPKQSKTIRGSGEVDLRKAA